MDPSHNRSVQKIPVTLCWSSTYSFAYSFSISILLHREKLSNQILPLNKSVKIATIWHFLRQPTIFLKWISLPYTRILQLWHSEKLLLRRMWWRYSHTSCLSPTPQSASVETNSVRWRYFSLKAKFVYFWWKIVNFWWKSCTFLVEKYWGKKVCCEEEEEKLIIDGESKNTRYGSWVLFE